MKTHIFSWTLILSLILLVSNFVSCSVHGDDPIDADPLFDVSGNIDFSFRTTNEVVQKELNSVSVDGIVFNNIYFSHSEKSEDNFDLEVYTNGKTKESFLSLYVQMLTPLKTQVGRKVKISDWIFGFPNSSNICDYADNETTEYKGEILLKEKGENYVVFRFNDFTITLGNVPNVGSTELSGDYVINGDIRCEIQNN